MKMKTWTFGFSTALIVIYILKDGLWMVWRTWIVPFF
jgi:hypothetical protein